MNQLQTIQEKITQLRELRKWEVLAWLEFMLAKTQEFDNGKHVEILEEITNRLPLIIISSMEEGIGCNRCSIISVSTCSKEAERVSECIPDRHPKDKKFLLTPLLKDLIDNKENQIYIDNPRENVLVTNAEKSLFDKEEVNAVFFIKTNTLLGKAIIAIDAAGSKKEFPVEERDYLTTISRFLRRVEMEKERIKMKSAQVAQKTKIDTLAFFTAAIFHLLQNELTTIGGLYRRVEKAIKNGADDASILKKGKIILRAVDGAEKILLSLSELSYNLFRLETLNLHTCPIELIVDFFSNFPQNKKIALNNHCQTFPSNCFSTDQRKLEKTLCAVIKKLNGNKSPITVDLQQTTKDFTITINQEKGDGEFQKLEMMRTLGEAHDIKMLSVSSLDDLNLSAYLAVLPEISGSFKINKKSLVITFDLVC